MIDLSEVMLLSVVVVGFDLEVDETTSSEWLMSMLGAEGASC